MQDIVIKIKGATEASESLSKFYTELEDTTEPLIESSQSYLNVISSNFKDNGKTFGQPWAHLSAATINIKRKLKAIGQAIAVEKPLVRTGLVRNSFGYDLINRRQSNVGNATAYAQTHQEGGTVNYNGRQCTVPKRILAEVDAKRITMVANIFEKWVNTLVKKYGL